MKKLSTLLTLKLQIPAASYLMELAAIDWFKDSKRMDNVGRQKGCVAQVNIINLVIDDGLSYLKLSSSIITELGGLVDVCFVGSC